MTTPQTTVAVVDDHPVVLEGFCAGFASEPGFEVVATGSTADEALSIVARAAPDVIVMDLSMPGDVFGAITQIAETSATRIVVFTAFSSLESALRALEAGALGFVLKGASFDELLEAIRYAQKDELYIARQYAAQVLTALRSRRTPSAHDMVKLTDRERQIVGHLLNARTNREIAASINVSEKTVKRNMTMLMQKLHARNRVEVAVNAQKVTDWQPADLEAALP
jgi:two-component system nitrate/nitrite response regulator NarL